MQAIDLIDEAGSRVRLQHAQLPEEARELDKELRALNKEKDAAVRGQDFEKAGSVSILHALLLSSADCWVCLSAFGMGRDWGRHAGFMPFMLA